MVAISQSWEYGVPACFYKWDIYTTKKSGLDVLLTLIQVWKAHYQMLFLF